MGREVVAAVVTHSVLIVDDEERNVRLLQAYLHGEAFRTLTASSGAAALAAAAEHRPDVILLDAMMPGMTGFQVATRLKSDEDTKHIPIVMVTALDDHASKLQALECGVEEFLQKPVDRAELLVRVRNLLRLKEYSDFLQSHAQRLETEVRERTQQLESSYRETIFTLTRAAEHKDEETGAHVQRISHYSRELASRMGMDAHFQDQIFHASPMHDVGKIGIPDAILLKPGKLDAGEWDIMKTHTTLGASILERNDSPYLRMGADIALSHHERWDGTGYPAALRGDAIPVAARIMCICDVYDALRSKRPYKPPFTHEVALSTIVNGDGRTQPGHFDPQVLAAFADSHARFDAIFTELAG